MNLQPYYYQSHRHIVFIVQRGLYTIPGINSYTLRPHKLVKKMLATAFVGYKVCTQF